MKLSQKQIEWLQRLEDHGPERSGSVTGFFCRKNGLTVFMMKNKLSGELKSSKDMPQPYDPEIMADWEYTGLERITDAGRIALASQEATA